MIYAVLSKNQHLKFCRSIVTFNGCIHTRMYLVVDSVRDFFLFFIQMYFLKTEFEIHVERYCNQDI